MVPILQKLIERARHAIADGHEGSIIASRDEVMECVMQAALRTVPNSHSNTPTGWVPVKIYGCSVIDTVEGRPWLVRWAQPTPPTSPEIRLESEG